MILGKKNKFTACRDVGKPRCHFDNAFFKMVRQSLIQLLFSLRMSSSYTQYNLFILSLQLKTLNFKL